MSSYRLSPDDNYFDRLKRLHYPNFSFRFNGRADAVSAGEITECRTGEGDTSKVLISAVTQYLGAFPHSKVMVVTPSTRALLGGSVDHSRVSVLRVETLTQLLAVSHYATNENIGSRHVLMLFYQMSPVLLAHKGLSKGCHNADIVGILDALHRMAADNLLYTVWVSTSSPKSQGGLRCEDPNDEVHIAWKKAVGKQIAV